MFQVSSYGMWTFGAGDLGDTAASHHCHCSQGSQTCSGRTLQALARHFRTKLQNPTNKNKNIHKPKKSIKQSNPSICQPPNNPSFASGPLPPFTIFTLRPRPTAFLFAALSSGFQLAGLQIAPEGSQRFFSPRQPVGSTACSPIWAPNWAIKQI